jgi:type I restriction-modification system DNA methylase subunit
MTATLTINAIRDRAAQFAKDFNGITYESGFDQKFVNQLCWVFGISNYRLVDFQTRVKKLGGKKGRIDAFLPGKLLVEMKSSNQDLDKAYVQATEYLPGIKTEELPRHILVSDFATLHLYDQETKAPRLEIKLADFPQHIEPFLFLADYEAIAIREEQAANEQAADKMAGLHDAIKATDYQGQDLETYLVRLLFCLFAEDTGLFGINGLFLNLLQNHSKIDGSDLHGTLTALFDTLNRDHDKRPKNLPEHFANFPYINGALFKDSLAQCYFDEAARQTLIECAQLDWSKISPAIFGSLFQAIMHFDDEAAKAKTKKRREFGAHYTSEANILKVIRPLFLDELRAEFEKIRKQPKKLPAFQQKLASLNFFDPACGCGNFLVIAYRELRLLEIDVIEAIWGKKLNDHLDVDGLIHCNVDQFHGIEIDPSAAKIATVALWLTDHQMNLRMERFGNYYSRIPLVKKANIVCANALQIDWHTVLPAEKCSYVMGNPPFIGYSYQTKAQKEDLSLVYQGMNGAGVLDYVAAYIQTNPAVPVAFVSTNSITQGEQVAVLWKPLMSSEKPIHIHFAHRTFRWSNEGRGVAAVHCVIVGYGLQPSPKPLIFDYGDDIGGEPTVSLAENINPYLVDAATVFIEKRRKPLCNGIPEITKGSQPTDGGHLLLKPDEAEYIKKTDAIAAKYIRPFLGSEEFINGLDRFCLWLKDSTAQDRKASSEIQRRIKNVETMRLASSKLPTQKQAETPYLFGEIRQTNQPYLLIPRVSSENRQFVPIGHLPANVICGDANFMLPNATLFHFGLLCSTMHNAWMRTVCGRLKSDYRYSNTIVYNNFPWPQTPSAEQQRKIQTAAQAILDARQLEVDLCAAQQQKCSLAVLYSPGNMPQALIKAHAQLDKAVDAAYNYKGSKDDAARVAFLFGLYQALTPPEITEQTTEATAIPAQTSKKKATRKPANV